MNVIKPTPSQSAFILKKFFEEQGITLKISQAQEAIARTWGYSSWNALTSNIAPKVGDPKGRLQQNSETAYTLLGGTQTTVMIAVKNLQVSVKHDDEGVVVDVFSKAGLDKGEESLGSTWVMFDEAEEDSTENDEDTIPVRAALSGIHLAKLLLTAVSISGSYDMAHQKIWKKDNDALRAFISDSADTELDDSHILISYGFQSHQTVRIRDLIHVSTFGEDGWMLLDGTKIWVHQSKTPDTSMLNTEVAELLEELLTASELNVTGAPANAPILRKDSTVIQRAILGLEVELATEVITFKTVRGNIRGITIGALLASYKEGLDNTACWNLPSGDRLILN
ncbi:MAG: hypothetical protein Q7S87_09975 [Agitococcus sp.]|nr:hypothetical protein [Agitococcus sp.]